MENKEYTVDDILAELDAKNQAKKEQLAQEIKEIVEGPSSYNNPEQAQPEVLEVEHPTEEPVQEQKIELYRETLGTEQEGLDEAIAADEEEKAKKSNKGKIATIAGTVVATAALIGIIIASRSCAGTKKEEKQPEETTTSITTEVPVEEEVVTEAITTTEHVFTTTSSITEELADTTVEAEVETTTEAETTKEEVRPEDLIVTTTSAQTTQAPETVAQTTTASTTVATTTKATAPEPVMVITASPENVIKPITIDNLDKKVDALIKTLKDAHVFNDRESYENIIRIFYSDFTEHDGYKEIRSIDLDGYLAQFLSNLGSNNAIILNNAYLGIDDVNKDMLILLPKEIFPKQSREIIEKFNKYVLEYADELNDNQVLDEELDYEYYQDLYISKYQKFLDDYKELSQNGEEYVGIADFNRYLELLEEYVNNRLTEEAKKAELCNLSNKYEAQQKRREAYYRFFEKVISLMKTNDYAKMGSAKMGLIPGLGALVSGWEKETPEEMLIKYQDFTKTITESTDDIRYYMVKINRENNAKNEGKTIDLKEVVQEYVEQATTITPAETQMLDDIFEQISAKNREEAKVYTR